MSYKKLKNFKEIINRADFNYISNEHNINRISEIISRLAVPDGKEDSYISLLGQFLGNLDSFYIWINGKAVPDIKEGHSFCREQLERGISILRMRDLNKRRSISKGYIKKFNKMFLYGMSRILEGLRIAFDPNIVSSTSIEKGQLANYILDKVEGLGRKYLFNTAGPDSFVSGLSGLTKEEVVVTQRLLSTLPNSQVRRERGWIDVGIKNSPVRILIKPSTFGNDQVCFLFRNNDRGKARYRAKLDVPPKKAQFEAA